MTITLPAAQDSFLNRLVALGRYASLDEAIVEAVRRLETEEALEYLNPRPMTADEAEQVYAADPAWEAVELSLSGRVEPER